jgi:hypothetical protein
MKTYYINATVHYDGTPIAHQHSPFPSVLLLLNFRQEKFDLFKHKTLNCVYIKGIFEDGRRHVAAPCLAGSMIVWSANYVTWRALPSS